MKLRSILIGMGSILNIFPAAAVRRIKLTVPDTDDEALRKDYEALRSDWEAVGGDMRTAMYEIDKDEETGGDAADELDTWNDDGGQ